MVQKYVPQCQKTYIRTYAPSEDSDQTAHSRSLIRIFTGHSLDSQGCQVSSSEQLTMIRLCGYAGWSESSLGGTFSHVAAHYTAVRWIASLACWPFNRIERTIKQTSNNSCLEQRPDVYFHRSIWWWGLTVVQSIVMLSGFAVLTVPIAHGMSII